MGCKSSKDDSSSASMKVQEEWHLRNLPEVDKSLFENDSEIQIYKTINLIRSNPQWAISFIKNLR